MDYELTKQSFSKLKELANNDPKIARNIKEIILKLRVFDF